MGEQDESRRPPSREQLLKKVAWHKCTVCKEYTYVAILRNVAAEANMVCERSPRGA